ncbi:MAG: tape measure protein [Lysobacter sp.]
MASASPNLRVRISADLADIKQGLGLLRGELAKVKSQAATALPANNAFVNGIKRARTELVSFIGVYASLRGLGILSGLADEAALVRGRLRNAKADYAAILAIANETRTGLTATADLYSRVERSTRGQIKNQSDLLTLTRSVNQAIKLSYAGAAQGEAAVLQLGQALSSGKLAGDELRSLSENAPRLVEAIATGMGVARGELKKLGAEGKLTAEVVIKALLSQAAVLEKEYKQVPVTVGDAFTQLRNSFLDYVGDQDAATGASRRFAATVQQIAKDLPRYLDPVLRAITLLLENLDVLAVFMITRMAGAAIPALITAFTALRAIIVAASGATVTLRGVMMLLGGPVGIAIAALAAGIYYLYKRTNEARQAAEEHNKALEANKNLAYQSRDAALADAKAKRQQAADTLKAAQAALAEASIRSQEANRKANLIVGEGRANRTGQAAAAAGMDARRAQAAVTQAEREYEDWGRRLVDMALAINDDVLSSTADAAAGATGTATKAVKGMVDAAALARDAISRQLELLDQLLEDGKVSLADFYAKKQALQLADIDAQIKAAQAEAATAKTSDQQSKALTEIIKLQRDRAAIGPAVARDQAKAEEELAKQLGAVYVRLLEAQGETGRARRAGLEEEFQQLIIKLEAESNTAGVAIVRKLINIEAAKGQLDEFEAEMQRVLGTLGTAETSLAAQQQAGFVGAIAAERELHDLRTRSLDQLIELRQRTIEFLQTLSPDSPEAASVRDFLNQLNGGIAGVASDLEKLRQQAADAAVDSLSGLFMDLVEGSKSAGDALKDFVRGFALAMAQIAARALATYLVLQLLDAIYPGLGKATAAGMSAGVNHGGGIAGAGGRMRHNLSPLLFGAAPRYHGGGIAGLAPDEVPAILQKGEEVLTKTDPRHRDNGGGQGGGTVVKQPIVAIGDRAVADALAGAAGEEVVITHVRNNWGALSRGG